MKKKLSLRPQKINERAWFYEEKGGVYVVIQLFQGKQYMGTATALVPKAKLKRYLDKF